MSDLRYPIGRFSLNGEPSDEQVRRAMDDIAATPSKLRAADNSLSEAQLDTPYRPEGWTVRQVVHHVPDSHLNSYCRIKLALTEDEPTIKAYNEAQWAELSDGRTGPVEVSLALLEALHTRWVSLLNSLGPADFKLKFRHPEIGVMNIGQSVCLYGWHGRHHAAHITSLRERMRW